MKTTEPIKLRQRVMPSGNISLYLDTYSKGKRRYEYLNLYLIPETDRASRLENKKTMDIANAVLQQRLQDFRAKRYSVDIPMSDVSIHDYIDIYIGKRQLADGTISIFRSFQNRMDKFSPGARIVDTDAAFCERFKRWLLESPAMVTKSSGRITRNSAHTFWLLFEAILNSAHRDGLIPFPAYKKVEPIRKERKSRVYLTQDEVRKLAATPCDREIVKRAFLFSCLTGLRISDIIKLKWGEVSQEGGYTRLTFHQKKTGDLEYLDVSKEAAALMGEAGGADEAVFCGLAADARFYSALKIWVARAGITKPVTFHTGRHTFAVMLLELDVNIYTVQKLLGHRRIDTTEIYADIVDKTKRGAVDKIPSLLCSSADK